MSSTHHFVDEAIKRLELDEFLSADLERAGFGGVEVTKTPLGTRLTIYAMKPGLVIGRRGESIRDLTRILEEKFGVNNPQIAVAEVEVPELNPYIMATRIASALQRGIHYRRSGYWALNRIMEAGALGVEISVRGKLSSRRARYEKFKGGYLPKAGDPSIRSIRRATVHVKLKPGLVGVKVKIMPPQTTFPDRVEIIYPSPTEESVPSEPVKSQGEEVGLEEEIIENVQEPEASVEASEPAEPLESEEANEPVETEPTEENRDANSKNE